MHCPSCGVVGPSGTIGPVPTNYGASPYGSPLNYYDQNPYGLSNSQSLPLSPQQQYPTPISVLPPDMLFSTQEKNKRIPRAWSLFGGIAIEIIGIIWLALAILSNQQEFMYSLIGLGIILEITLLLTFVIIGMVMTARLKLWGWFITILLGSIGGTVILLLPGLALILFGIFAPRLPRTALPLQQQPTPPRRHKMMISIILGAVALVLILGSVAVFASFRGSYLPTSTSTHLSTPTVTIPIVTIPYSPHSGKLVLNDLLRDSSSHNFGEGRGTKSGNTCQFKDGAYHVSQSTGDSVAMCGATASNFSNFVYEVQMTIIKGDGGGIFFRADAQSAKFYSFFVGADGVYALTLYTDSSHAQILRNTTLSDAIKQGLNQTNLIAVSAIGNTITLYINHQLLVSVNDSTYSHGQIGLVAASYRNSDYPTEVAFSNAKVWTLP
jgi:hypothetical protein